MTRDAVFILLVCSDFALGHPPTTNAVVALVPHFEKPPGQKVLHWIAPMIAEVFRPAGLSMEWYKNRDAAPVNAARTLDVWFHGDCWPVGEREFSPLHPVPLGWVVVQDGHIAKDIAVDCATVMQLAAKARSPTANRTLLDIVFLRLMERVIAHELLHVLLMSARHGNSDFSRPRICSSDWQRIGDLTQAEIQSLRQLCRPGAAIAFADNP